MIKVIFYKKPNFSYDILQIQNFLKLINNIIKSINKLSLILYMLKLLFFI